MEISRKADAILSNPDKKSHTALCSELRELGAEFIRASRDEALRYSSNRLIWKKQSLFVAVLSEQLVHEDLDVSQKEKLCCYGVNAYVLAGEPMLALQLAEWTIRENAFTHLKQQAGNKSNQKDCPGFAAVFNEASARHLQSLNSNDNHRSSIAEYYQQATFFYAQARNILRAKQCAEQWLSVADDWKSIEKEACDASDDRHRLLYAGILFEQIATTILKSPRYGYDNLRQDFNQVKECFVQAMHCFVGAEQVDLLKSVVHCYRFINWDWGFYQWLLNDTLAADEAPLLAAVFCEVYGDLTTAAAYYQRADFPSEMSRCIQEVADRLDKEEALRCTMEKDLSKPVDESSGLSMA